MSDAGDDFDEDDEDDNSILTGSGVAAGLCPTGQICLLVLDEEYSPMTGVAMTESETRGVIEMLEKCLVRQGAGTGRMN